MYGIFGTIDNPLGTTFGDAGGYASVEGGLGLFITNVVRLVTIVAGLWSFVNSAGEFSPANGSIQFLPILYLRFATHCNYFIYLQAANIKQN